jgi:transcription elongation GreA/GreB family factor
LDRAVVVDQASSASGEVGIGSTVDVEDANCDRITVEISSVGGGASLGDLIAVSHPGDRRLESG